MKSFITVTDKPCPAKYFPVLHWLAPLALFFETTIVILCAITAGHFCSKKTQFIFPFLIQH